MRSSDGSSQDASRFGGSRSLMYGVSYVVKTSKRRISRTEKKDVNASLVLIENEGVTFFFLLFCKQQNLINYKLSPKKSTFLSIDRFKEFVGNKL